MVNFTLTSPDFANDSLIPKDFSCLGKNISPALKWKGAPEETKSFALTVIDPDAPGGHFVHWSLFNIPSTIENLPQKYPPHPAFNKEIKQGMNDFGKVGYGGPCPPPNEKHAYVFTLYALDTVISLKDKSSCSELEYVIKGHILAEAKLIGYFAK